MDELFSDYRESIKLIIDHQKHSIKRATALKGNISAEEYADILLLQKIEYQHVLTQYETFKKSSEMVQALIVIEFMLNRLQNMQSMVTKLYHDRSDPQEKIDRILKRERERVRLLYEKILQLSESIGFSELTNGVTTEYPVSDN